VLSETDLFVHAFVNKEMEVRCYDDNRCDVRIKGARCMHSASDFVDFLEQRNK